MSFKSRFSPNAVMASMVALLPFSPLSNSGGNRLVDVENEGIHHLAAVGARSVVRVHTALRVVDTIPQIGRAHV